MLVRNRKGVNDGLYVFGTLGLVGMFFFLLRL